MDKLQKLYYSPAGYQKGKTAASKLHTKIPPTASGAAPLTKQEIQYWLDRQPIYQIYKPKPKAIKFPHYTQTTPNNTHQIDLLFLPHDQKYKYALTVIDIASRYKEAQPLKTKTPTEVSQAIQNIYDRSPLNFPSVIMCDKGREFMGEFIKLMKKNNTKIKYSLNKKKVAFVERFNRTLSEKLFAHQYANEIESKEIILANEPKPGRNLEWVDRLPDVIAAMNDEVTRMIDMKPVDAIKLESVKQPEYDDDTHEEELSFDSVFRYLYKAGEAEGDNRYRATDPIWSVDFYYIDEIRPVENQPTLYTLQHMPDDRTFTREQLQVIPVDTDESASSTD